MKFNKIIRIAEYAWVKRLDTLFCKHEWQDRENCLDLTSDHRGLPQQLKKDLNTGI